MTLHTSFRLVRDGRIITDVRVEGPGPLTPALVTGKAVYAYMRPFAALEDIEKVWSLPLDARKQLIKGPFTVAMGGLESAPILPAQVFRPVIRLNAHSVIVVHNHPGGHAAPSDDDHEATTLLRLSGQVLNVELVDHVIIGEEGFYSFAEHWG